jgi:hypothetical protein
LIRIHKLIPASSVFLLGKCAERFDERQSQSPLSFWLASAIAMSRAEERRSVASFSNSARFRGLVASLAMSSQIVGVGEQLVERCL